MAVITERYPAVVTSTEDDEKRGRIQVACVGLLGDEETALPMMVEPVHEWGWFTVPDVGETVEVEVVTGEEDDESFGQTSIDAMDIKWRGKRFYTDDTVEGKGAEPRPIHSDFSAKNYGKRRGFATPIGHIILFDDTEGDTKIYLTWVKEKGNTDDITHVLIDKDGSAKISVLKKQFVHLKVANEIEISLEEAKHTLVMKPNQIELKLDQGASLKIVGKDSNVTTTLGDAAVKAAIADHLKTFYNALKGKLDAFDAHVHPTGMGASGPPNPTITANAWNSNIESTKLKFPDG